MNIKFFNELPESELCHIATLHFNQWSPMNQALNIDDKIEEFTKEYAQQSDKLPTGFAVYENDELVGFCRLKILNLKKYPELTPWISSLLVLKQGDGYGKKIVEFAENTLKKMGYDHVYIYSSKAGDFYKKLEFQFVGMVDKNDAGQAELYKKEF
ncbi:MAG: GNAT family N-acetyltransferase [Alphaproteobacteria bacterium]|nr:GNAT family N-acetyltransferase [Alphaproteobacteria bacterium]